MNVVMRSGFSLWYCSHYHSSILLLACSQINFLSMYSLQSTDYTQSKNSYHNCRLLLSARRGLAAPKLQFRQGHACMHSFVKHPLRLHLFPL